MLAGGVELNRYVKKYKSKTVLSFKLPKISQKIWVLLSEVSINENLLPAGKQICINDTSFQGRILP